MNTIKVLKQICPYCDKEFTRNYPLTKEGKQNKDLMKKYFNEIEIYVNHLMNEHEVKVNRSLNEELGINHEDLI